MLADVIITIIILTVIAVSHLHACSRGNHSYCQPRDCYPYLLVMSLLSLLWVLGWLLLLLLLVT